MGNVFNVHHVGETKLYKELKSRVEKRSEPSVEIDTLINNLPKLCEEAAERAKLILQYFPQYTLHDETHFLRVTELMYLVLGDTLKELNDIEICLLILSAFYHDQGMVLEGSEYEVLMKNEDYLVFRDNWIIDHPNYSEINEHSKSSFLAEEEKKGLIKKQLELDAALLTDYLREKHGERGYDYIKNTLKSKDVLKVNNVDISTPLAKICISHTKSIDWIEDKKNGLSYDELIGTDEVNSIYLAIILRLADILDFDADRTPDILFKSIHFTNNISIKEWQKHRSVVGWKITKKSILYAMEFWHPVYEKAARSLLDWIDSELYESHTLIRRFPASVEKYRFNLPEKVNRSKLKPKDDSYIYHDLEFSLSRDEIIKLLMTDKLYGRSSLFIRELLQNALDALRLRKAMYAKDNIDIKYGKVIFRHYLDDNGQQVIECKDNGCGMDEEVVKKYLGKVGRSYYRSPEFERERKQLKEKGVDFEPCSQFGIGFMSCFMVGDRIEILTRKDYGNGKELGRPLLIEINGIGGLFVIREGDKNQEIGTLVRVYCREKPLIFDERYDRIHLLDTLSWYAIATEFPIEAKCEIVGINGGISIPTTIMRKETFLEKNSIAHIKTITIDLSSVNKNLFGFISQSFLMDESGKPCLKNEYGNYYIDKKPNGTADVFFHDKTRNKFIEVNSRNYETTVCMDGILITGAGGRGNDGRELWHSEQLNPNIGINHECIIDIRGSIKPELSPARRPARNELTDISSKWRYVHGLIRKGEALLWEEVMELLITCQEVFWELFFFYSTNLIYLRSNTIKRHLQIPIEDGSWIKISEIESFSFDLDYIYIGDTTYRIKFPDHIVRWDKYSREDEECRFEEALKEALIGMSKLYFKGGKSSFYLREFFNEEEMPIDSFVIKPFRRLILIPFDGVDSTCIAMGKTELVFNLTNPIIKLVKNSQNKESKEELLSFVYSFLYDLEDAAKSAVREKVDLTTNIEKELKYSALLFMKIDWSKYSKEYHPPYKIFVDDGEEIVITKEDFERWAK